MKLITSANVGIFGENNMIQKNQNNHFKNDDSQFFESGFSVQFILLRIFVWM